MEFSELIKARKSIHGYRQTRATRGDRRDHLSGQMVALFDEHTALACASGYGQAAGTHSPGRLLIPPMTLAPSGDGGRL